MADESNRVSGQELSEEKGAARADLVRETKVTEPDAWKSFKVLKPLRMGDVGKTAVDTW